MYVLYFCHTHNSVLFLPFSLANECWSQYAHAIPHTLFYIFVVDGSFNRINLRNCINKKKKCGIDWANSGTQSMGIQCERLAEWPIMRMVSVYAVNAIESNLHPLDGGWRLYAVRIVWQRQCVALRQMWQMPPLECVPFFSFSILIASFGRTSTPTNEVRKLIVSSTRWFQNNWLDYVRHKWITGFRQQHQQWTSGNNNANDKKKRTKHP